MHIQSLVVALSLLTVPSTAQALKGFSYGSTNSDGSCRTYSQFKSLFEKAKKLHGAPGFTAAHLYTSIQCGTSVTPIEAFRAAIDTDTKLLVGLWASAGKYVFENELNALIGASKTLGTKFTDRIVAMSVGSEDLYRNSAEGIDNDGGQGATPKQLVDYIGWMRDWIRGTLLERKPITHIDTWTVWVRSENSGVVDAVDILGHNSFPYFEGAAIEQGKDVFFQALGATESVAKGKPVWVTETGWPTTGPTKNRAYASVSNANTYWKTVGCSLLGKRNTFWYTLEDLNTTQAEISFGITPVGSSTPKFNLSC